MAHETGELTGEFIGKKIADKIAEAKLLSDMSSRNVK